MHSPGPGPWTSTAGKHAPPLPGLLKPSFKKPLPSLCNQQESLIELFSPFVLLTSEAQIRTLVGCYLLPLSAKLCLQHMEWVFRRDLKKIWWKEPYSHGIWGPEVCQLPTRHSFPRPPGLPLWIRTPICLLQSTFDFEGHSSQSQPEGNNPDRSKSVMEAQTLCWWWM